MDEKIRNNVVHCRVVYSPLDELGTAQYQCDSYNVSQTSVQSSVELLCNVVWCWQNLPIISWFTRLQQLERILISSFACASTPFSNAQPAMFRIRRRVDLVFNAAHSNNDSIYKHMNN
jgi:hypothetical protein